VESGTCLQRPCEEGDGAEKGKDKKRFRVGIELRRRDGKGQDTGDGYLGMCEYVRDELACIYGTIALLSTRSRASLHKGKHISLSNHTNRNREGNCGAGGLLLTSGIV